MRDAEIFRLVDDHNKHKDIIRDQVMAIAALQLEVKALREVLARVPFFDRMVRAQIIELAGKAGAMKKGGGLKAKK
jgi:hypothetical protein